VNELSVDLSPEGIDHGNLKVFIIAQTAIPPMLGKLLGVRDCFRVCIELDADAVPHRNAVFHVEEELLRRSILHYVG
jgi:hypothetical protein